MEAPKDPAAIDRSKQRNQCLYCDEGGQDTFDAIVHEHNQVPSNLRSFKDRSFTMWRCNKCRSLICLDVVDLSYYYSKYTFYPDKLDFILRMCYSRMLKRFTDHGMLKTHSVLDYGCNHGLFCDYLTQYAGFTNVHGYDPYSSVAKYRDLKALQECAPFDFINLQDVLEHVESPNDLMKELASLLKPGGYLHVGTPNAAEINLQDITAVGNLNHLHAPYHLYIPTPETVENLARKHGLVKVSFYDHQYGDGPIGNEKTANFYQELKGGDIDVLGEPVDICSVLMNPRLIFYAVFGYYLRTHANMATVFYKPESKDDNKHVEMKKTI